MKLATTIAALAFCSMSLSAQSKLSEWPQHSEERPKPRVVQPGASYSIAPPADAIVLFDGSSLAKWTSGGAPAKWRLDNGAFVAVPSTGTLSTRDSYGDVQFHIEWASPNPPVGTGQDRGNSGVFFADGRYEVQVLDSRNNDTYADGQAGALYGQFPPLVNAARAPGEWQTYDIVYHRPRFKADGTLQSAARLTVFHNGVLVQDNMELVGPPRTGRARPTPRIRIGCRSRCRTMAIPSASATSGCAISKRADPRSLLRSATGHANPQRRAPRIAHEYLRIRLLDEIA